MDSVADAFAATAAAGKPKQRERALALVKAGLLASASPLTIGRYEVRGVLGRGAMGVVYRAWDPELQRSVALKLVEARPEDPERGRLLREGQALAALDDPHVVTVLDAGLHEDGVYLAMAEVEGTTLSQWLSAQSRSSAAIVDVFVQAARALATVHRAGIVHRDFKPDNVVIDASGHATLVDFGLARVEASLSTGEASRGSGTSRAGTPGYAAPEQVRGGRIGAEADQFAWCVALHEALTGSRPAADAHPDRAIVRPVREVIERGLSSDPAKRWHDMEEVARRSSARPRSWLPLGIGVAIVALALSLGGSEAPTESAPPEQAELVDPAPGRDALEAARLANDEHRYDDAIEQAEHAIELAAAAHDTQTEFNARLNLAFAIGSGRNEIDEALLVVRSAEASLARLGGTPKDRAQLLSTRANVLHHAGLNPLAIVDMRTAIAFMDASGQGSSVRLWQGLGSIQARLGDDAGSLKSHDIALSKAAEELGSEHPDYAAIVLSRARTLRNLGRAEEAITAFKDGIAGYEKHHGPSHRALAIPLLNLGSALRDSNATVEAAEVHARYRAIVSAEYPPEHSEHARAATTLAETRFSAGDIEGGLQAATEAAVLAETILGDEHRSTAYAYELAGQAMAATGDPEGGRAKIERALEIAEAAFGPEHPQLVHYLAVAAEAAGRNDDADSARAHIRRARAISNKVTVRPDLLKLLDAVEAEVESAA